MFDVQLASVLDSIEEYVGRKSCGKWARISVLIISENIAHDSCGVMWDEDNIAHVAR